MKSIDEKTYNDLKNARNVLCNYCEANECENCIVTRLLDDAYYEAVEASIETE